MSHSVSRRDGRTRGFTLIELMVTLAVLGVMMAIAIPSFRYVQNSSRLSAASNELVATLQSARMEAIRSNARVVVCTSNQGLACDVSASASGLLVFADANRDNAVSVGETTLRVSNIPVPATLQGSAKVADGIVQYRSDGLARDKGGNMLNGQIRICVPTTVPADNIRDVAITNGGRITVRRRSDSTCAAPADA